MTYYDWVQHLHLGTGVILALFFMSSFLYHLLLLPFLGGFLFLGRFLGRIVFVGRQPGRHKRKAEFGHGTLVSLLGYERFFGEDRSLAPCNIHTHAYMLAPWTGHFRY